MSLPLSDLRIGLLTASASRLGGGVFEAVVAQARMITELGGDVRVFALRDAYSDEDRGRFGAVPVMLADVVGPAQIGFSPALVPELLRAGLDCLHLHGIWMYPSAAGSQWRRKTGKAYFISPHGMLDPWITGRGKLKKAIARTAYERMGWRRAEALHGLTRREAADIARESGRHDTIVIPNAGPAVIPGPRRALPAPIIGYIGRIHPKKNLIALVKAWGLARRPDGARLVIAGWGDPRDVAELEAAVSQSDGTAAFVGPLYGAAKAELLHSTRFVVLPSHSEGLPMSVLEAWACGAPTVMTAECNLAEGYAAGAAIECGYDAPAIAERLEFALGLGEAEWQAMSGAALALAGGPFAAATVAAHWASAYRAGAAGETGR